MGGFIDKKCIGAFKIFALVVLFIVVYNLYLIWKWPDSEHVQVDVFNRQVFNLGWSNCCSWWPISHFILFAILGYLYPNCDIPILAAGVGWEIFEELLAFIRQKRQTRHVVMGTRADIQYRSSWWAGSVQDIAFNFAGFYLGKAIREFGV